MNTVGGYQCSCSSGFQGKHCDQGNLRAVSEKLPYLVNVVWGLNCIRKFQKNKQVKNVVQPIEKNKKKKNDGEPHE